MTKVVLMLMLTLMVAAIHSELNSLALAHNEAAELDKVCLPWMRPVSNCSVNPKMNKANNCSLDCECGSSLNGLLSCDKTQVKLLACYCMSQSKILNKTIVGNCLYSCSRKYMIDIPHKLSELDNFTCRHDQKRTGQLCGNCITNHSPPVYSYSIACVSCNPNKHYWVRYVAVAFLPLTIFYFIVLAFRISAVAPKLQCYILVSQVIAMPTHIRYLYALQNKYIQSHTLQIKLVEVGISMFSIWNLDFFRAIYHPFCIHPKMSSLGVVALDYLVATYPLLLILLTYGFIQIYSHIPVVQQFLKPVHKCCFYFRKEWNIKQSLIGVFATFILLSYVKILNTSFDLLLPTNIYDMNGAKQYPSFLYHNGSIETFGDEHKPFAVLAIFMMLIFNFIPLMLLYLYPCRCFQKLLNQFRLCHFQALHIFMDTFLSNFRTKPVDCRYFAAIYLTVRVINLLVFSLTLSRFYYPLVSTFMLMAALLVALFQPYKSSVYNKLDVFLFIVIVYGYLAASAYALSPGETHFNNFFTWTIIIAAAIPVCYVTGLLVTWATPRRIKDKIKGLLESLWQQQSTPEDDILEASDYRRSFSVSGNTNSEYTALQGSAVEFKSYSPQSPY